MDTEALSQQLTALYGRLRTLSQTLGHRATALELPLDKLMEDLSTALDGILLADNTAGYVDANPAACMLTGYDRAALLQAERLGSSHLEDRSAHRARAAFDCAPRHFLAQTG